jgi:predicted transposase YbfD/YdcC
MSSFLGHIKDIPDPRVAGMVTYPLDGILPAALVGVLCGAGEGEAVELRAREYLPWLKRLLPYRCGIPQAPTFRKGFRLITPAIREGGFASWIASWQEIVRGGVAGDGKTRRGSKKAAGGSGALHLLSACACEAGLVIGQRAVDGNSNAIKAISGLLEMLAITGAIVSIDAMGAQKAIAAAMAAKEADYVLALKRNQGALHEDGKTCFADAEGAAHCASGTTAAAGHGRIEARTIRAPEAIDWLKERHPDWQNLRSVAAVTAKRSNQKTGEIGRETRFYISSLAADPGAVLKATRAHWRIDNNLHWQLDVAFDEDRCRTRKDFSPLNFAAVRHRALNLLNRDGCKLSLKRNRLKASVNARFRARLLAC